MYRLSYLIFITDEGATRNNRCPYADQRRINGTISRLDRNGRLFCSKVFQGFQLNQKCEGSIYDVKGGVSLE